MIINCSKELVDLKGEVVKDNEGKAFTVGEALSNIIVSSKEGGKMKLYILGTKLFAGGNIEVDDADLSLIKNAVRTTEFYGNALIPGQLEVYLEGLKKEE